MKVLKILVKAIFAGIMIAIGGTIFLMSENNVIGSCLFAIGLFTIVVNDLNLFTGKVGYIIGANMGFVVEVFLTLIGNFIGTFLVGSMLQYTRMSKFLIDKSNGIVNIKLSDGIFSIIILSVFCGILMYLAVNGYKMIEDPIGKYLAVFLGVVVFILSGFEHCVANMYYFTIANVWSLHAVGYMLIMILGNSAGAILFSVSEKFIKGK